MVVQDVVVSTPYMWLRLSMLRRLIRFGVLRLLHLFYPHVAVQHADRLPTSGPIIFVLNHPNGLLDPLLLMAVLKRPVAFLAKSTFFAHPLGRLCMDAFGALPVYRHQDAGLTGAADGDAVARNETTFARCRVLLSKDRALALFPEGTTHSGSRLLPLKTGAARIALGAEAENNWQLAVQIVPVGLWYQHKTQFRSSALLVIGQPFGITDYAASHRAEPRNAVQALTDAIDTQLDSVVLQAENAELLTGMPVVSAWVAPDAPHARLLERHQRTAALLAAYQRLAAVEPQRLAALAQQARRYARTLRMFGVADPWALELASVRQWRVVALALLLVITLPLALLGFALSYGPYRLAGLITPRLVGYHDTLIGTGKLIVGSILVLIGWVIAAIVVGMSVGSGWGWLVAALAPPLAYVALRWGEGWRELRAAIAYSWLRTRHQTLTQHLVARRRALAAAVWDAVRDAEALPVEAQQSATMSMEQS